jgi:hypothetical protein
MLCPRQLLVMLLVGWISHSALAGVSVIHNPINDTPADSSASSARERSVDASGVDLDDAEREANELLRRHREIEEKYRAQNPMSPPPGQYRRVLTQPIGQSQLPDPMQFPQAGVPAVLAPLQGILGNRIVENYVKAISNPDFITNATTVMKSRSRTRFMILDGLLIVAMMIFRAWRSSKQERLLGRIWVRLYCFGLTTVLCGGVLPILIFGEPYEHVLRGLYRVFVP